MATPRIEQTNKHYGGGKWMDGEGNETFTTKNSAAGEPLRTFAHETDPGPDTARATAYTMPYGLC